MASEKPSLRVAARRVAAELQAHGHIAYFAGGCVRDRLLGLEPKDYDIATGATPDQIRNLFRRTHDVGAAFGVVLVRLGGWSIEVTTFRADGTYSDSRHPDSVEYAGPQEDARRRDFTINALFEEPHTGRIIDFVGGEDDLKAAVVRAVGDPEQRLKEDQLRALRAVRFAARFGFALDPRTAEAIRANAANLRGVSRERIGHEIRSMLQHSSRAQSAAMIQTLGLDAAVFDEPSADVPLIRLGGLEEAVYFEAALAAWWLDRHDGGEPPPTGPWRRELVLSNDEAVLFSRIIELEGALRTEWDEMGIAARKRLAVNDGFGDALSIVATTHPEAAAAVQQSVDELAVSGLAPPPLVDGETLISLGLEPGPAFSDILRSCYDAQLEGRVTTPDEARCLARNLVEADEPPETG